MSNPGIKSSVKKTERIFLCNNVSRILKTWFILYSFTMLLSVSLLLSIDRHYLYYVAYALSFLIFFSSLIWMFKKVYLPFRNMEKSMQKFNLEHDFRFIKELDVYCTEETGKTFFNFTNLYENFNAIKMTNVHAEYRALQNQINPHFLYNTLEAIRSDALCEGADNIASITEALATFFRYTISKVNSMVTLEAELNNSETYFTIQNYRFGDKISLKINLSEENTSIIECKIPKMTLQPIIENAIMHGLEPKLGKGTVEIDFLIIDDKLVIKITDDGVGMDVNKLINLNERLSGVSSLGLELNVFSENSIGLINVNNRIKLEFGEQYGLRIDSIQNFGTCVELTLPILKISKR